MYLYFVVPDAEVFTLMNPHTAGVDIELIWNVNGQDSVIEQGENDGGW